MHDQAVVDDHSLDHYTRLVQRLLRSPVALVSVIEGDRQVFRAASGLQGEADRLRSTPLTHSLCRHVVEDAAPLVVGDARSDPRLAREPAVVEDEVVAYAGFPLRAADGQVVGSLCALDREPRAWGADDLETLHDLSLACSAEMQHREATVETSHALARALLDQIGVAVAFYDAEGRLVLANRHARGGAETAGLSLERPSRAGTQVRRADNRTPVAPDEQILVRALGGAEDDFDVVWVGEVGEERAVSARSRQLLRDDGTLWGTVVSANDVTDLARALQVKDSFVSTVSHELRTPLTAVVGYAELLADELEGIEGDTAQAQQALDVIRRRAVDLQARISDLLDMTDVRRRLSLASLDVSALVRRVVATFTEPAFARHQTVGMHVDGVQRALLDEHRITQVVENLLSNAVTYAGEGGHVEVAVTSTDDMVRIDVSDDGGGMSPSEVAQAFDRFWRATSAHEAALPGIGVGLSLVRDIAVAHHGTVTLDSAVGLGTTVRVELPRTPVAPDPAAPA